MIDIVSLDVEIKKLFGSESLMREKYETRVDKITKINEEKNSSSIPYRQMLLLEKEKQSLIKKLSFIDREMEYMSMSQPILDKFVKNTKIPIKMSFMKKSGTEDKISLERSILVREFITISK